MKNNITKFIMLTMPVNDMPKMKEFYTEKLGFQITSEYRQDDGHWWTSVKVPGDDVAVTFSTFHPNSKSGSMNLYLLAPDIETAHNNLSAKGATPTPITPDLYGPGSGVKWFSVADPEGNMWIVAAAKSQWM